MHDSRRVIRVNEHRLSVTPPQLSCALALALRQLWTRTEYEHFWVDAIWYRLMGLRGMKLDLDSQWDWLDNFERRRRRS